MSKVLSDDTMSLGVVKVGTTNTGGGFVKLTMVGDNRLMESLYRGHRFPPEIISHAVWLYHRFTLSLRDVEDLLAERGIKVSYEAIRSWCHKFGPEYSRTLRRRQGRLGDIWHVDEMFITIRGERHYLWRAVDQDGDVLDILVTRHRNKRAAKRFFRKGLETTGEATVATRDRQASKLSGRPPRGLSIRQPSNCQV